MKLPTDKIITTFTGESLRRRLDLQHGRTIVFTNGCFDMLHVGHMSSLHWIKSRTWLRRPFLVVGLDSDESVRRVKGPGRPIFNFSDRAYMLAFLACVDLVVGFGPDELVELIKVVKPSVLVKGAEYDNVDMLPGEAYVKAHGGVAVYSPMYGPHTSDIIKHVRNLADYDA